MDMSNSIKIIYINGLLVTYVFWSAGALSTSQVFCSTLKKKRLLLISLLGVRSGEGPFIAITVPSCRREGQG